MILVTSYYWRLHFSFLIFLQAYSCLQAPYLTNIMASEMSRLLLTCSSLSEISQKAWKAFNPESATPWLTTKIIFNWTPHECGSSGCMCDTNDTRRNPLPADTNFLTNFPKVVQVAVVVCPDIIQDM